MTPQPDQGALRASDADRERTVSQLRSHAADGRLEAAELEDRVGTALRARTLAELEAVVADLPAAPRPRRQRRDRRGAKALDEHVRTFVAVQVLLVAIWALTGFGYFWVIWPMMGWGIGLVAHARCARRRSRGVRSTDQVLALRG